MSDPAEQLARIYQAGFEINQVDIYPGMAAVVRASCMAIVKPTAKGLEVVGTPGWEIQGKLGVKTQANGRWIFQSKSETVEATDERLKALELFEHDLKSLMLPTAG